MLDISHFPSSKKINKISWAPILYRPIVESDEQFIIGSVALSENDFHLERANRLDRFKYLYPNHVELISVIANSALNAIEDIISKEKILNLETLNSKFATVKLGEIEKVECLSLQDFAASRMRAISSLYEFEALISQKPTPTSKRKSAKNDKHQFVISVYNIFNEQNLNMLNRFNFDKKTKKPTEKYNVHYVGDKLVANFGTLFGGDKRKIKNSEEFIKVKLWNLQNYRDERCSNSSVKDHVMLIHVSEPENKLDKKLDDNIESTLISLEEQAKMQDLMTKRVETPESAYSFIVEKDAA